MKYLLLAAGLFMLVPAFAQNSKVQSAYMFLNNYKSEQKDDYLKKAISAIDAASLHEASGIKGKTWYYRGLIYQAVLADDELKVEYPAAAKTAVESYSKALSLNDPKFREKDKSLTNLVILGNVLFNTGVEQYQEKDFKNAFFSFSSINRIEEVLAEHGKTTGIAEQSSDNAAMAAQQGGMTDEAIGLYEEKIKGGNAEAISYRILSGMYKEAGNETEAKRVIAEGLAKYPENVDLLIDDLNYYLAENKQEEAIEKLKKATSLQPDNDQLLFVLGTAFEKVRDMEGARNAYKKAISINNDNFKANYNLGRSHIEDANKIIEEMNALGFSSADQKRYEELNKVKIEHYNLAKPYFERAQSLDSEDEDVKRILVKINSGLSE